MMKKFSIFLLFFSALIGCRKNPIERLTNPLPDGSVPQSSGVFIIYDNELKTGGGVSLIPNGDNQSLDLKNHDNPTNAGNQIRYVWNGQPVQSQQFAGMQLVITPNGSTLLAAAPKNLSTPGYTKLKMRLRGSLSTATTLKIQGPSDGVSTPAELAISNTSMPSSWTDVELSIPSGDFVSVKIFAAFLMQYSQPPRTTSPGEGGVVYIDDLRYEK